MKLSVITPTHDPKWLSQSYESLKRQDHTDWEWVVQVNHKDGNPTRLRYLANDVAEIVRGDERVRVVTAETKWSGIGERKHHAFKQGTGEALIEMDHDDLLVPTALSEIAKAFEDPEIGFVYSDHIDFQEGAAQTEQDPVGQGYATYRSNLFGWAANGFTFYPAEIEGIGTFRSGTYQACHAFQPSAIATSMIYWAPNHVRAWRSSVYHEMGGHDPSMDLADDLDLICRTYLVSKFAHIRKPLYLYRVTGENTWSANIPKIAEKSKAIQSQYLEKLVLRECALADFPVYDLGAAFSARPGWKTVDRQDPPNAGKPGAPPAMDVVADLSQKWPWDDNSVGAFRASDFLEHLPDKQHTMREIWRCLKPGGWLFSSTPSTDGRGAFMDPTHVSFWNSPAWWYWTRRDQAKYINNHDIRFQEVQLYDHFPSDWHKLHNIPYVVATLIALKPGYTGAGEKLI